MEGYFAEIRLFAGNFEPMYWAFCQGQTMNISQNAALYSLLGTLYGGDGQQSFKLPDLRGRVPVGMGQGPGLQPVYQADTGGAEAYTMLTSQMPAHTHSVTNAGSGLVPISGNITATMNVNTSTGTLTSPANNFLADFAGGLYANSATPATTLASNAITISTNNLSVNLSGIQISPTGGNQPINKMMPFLVLNYIICVEGIYPSRN